MKDYLAGEQAQRCHRLRLKRSIRVLVSVPSSVMWHHLLLPHPPLPCLPSLSYAVEEGGGGGT